MTGQAMALLTGLASAAGGVRPAHIPFGTKEWMRKGQ
jgi:hypothetical protein